MQSISPNLNIMIKASEKASKILIRDFGEVENLQVSNKGPSDFVTNADLKAEKIIIEELKRAKPNYSFLSEEKGAEINKDNKTLINQIDHFADVILKKVKPKVSAEDGLNLLKILKAIEKSSKNGKKVKV